LIMLRKAFFASIAGFGLAFSAPAVAQDGDIVDIAIGSGSFNTLVAALQAADLVDVLRGDGPFTVFAPTDDAFAALPEGTLETLLDPANKDLLVSILTYHVVAGSVLAADVVTLDSAPTVQGESVLISVSDAGVQVDGANVVQTDIIATNGVVHVIDAVILPGTNATAVDASSWSSVKDSVR
jgi:uncharacterized surface protein with fasciclin (FAS1) repeats